MRIQLKTGRRDIPVSTIADLTVSFGAPLMGKVSPTLAVAFEWRLLLDALTRAQLVPLTSPNCGAKLTGNPPRLRNAERHPRSPNHPAEAV
jgi:hypothetical protein